MAARELGRDVLEVLRVPDAGDDPWYAQPSDDAATLPPDGVWERVSTGFAARVAWVDEELIPSDEEPVADPDSDSPIDPWSSDHADSPDDGSDGGESAGFYGLRG